MEKVKNVSRVIGSYNPWTLSVPQKQALIENLIQLWEWNDTQTPIAEIVENFWVAKTDIWFLQELYEVLSVEYKDTRKRNLVLSETCNAIKENELFNHVSTITLREETLYHSLQQVKKYIGQYYEMIFKYVESEALKKEEAQSHVVENVFNWEDPLFWIALFLYQKELNSAEKFLKNIRIEMSQKRKLYKFLQDDATKEVVWNEKKFTKSLDGFFVVLDYVNPSIAKYRNISAKDAENIANDLEKEVSWATDVSEALAKEHNPSERFFSSTREYAKKICSDVEIMGKIRNNLRSMSAKFNTRQMNPLKDHHEHVWQLVKLQEWVLKNKKSWIRKPAYEKFKTDNFITLTEYDSYFETGEWQISTLQKAIEWDIKISLAERWIQDLLSQELQFTQTMTWFGNNTYAPHFVKNINLAGQNLWIPRAATLKWRLDKICGTLKNFNKPWFVYVAPSMNIDIKLLANWDNTNTENIQPQVDISIQETTDKLFDSFLSDE